MVPTTRLLSLPSCQTWSIIASCCFLTISRFLSKLSCPQPWTTRFCLISRPCVPCLGCRKYRFIQTLQLPAVSQTYKSFLSPSFPSHRQNTHNNTDSVGSSLTIYISCLHSPSIPSSILDLSHLPTPLRWLLAFFSQKQCPATKDHRRQSVRGHYKRHRRRGDSLSIV